MDSSGVRRSAGGVRMDGRRRKEAPLGIIRKTLSISTLGIVPFRSKKELLHRAEQGQQSAPEERAVVQAARAAADRRVADADRRAQQAELLALHEAKIDGKHGRGLGRKAHKARKAVQGGEAVGMPGGPRMG